MLWYEKRRLHTHALGHKPCAKLKQRRCLHTWWQSSLLRKVCERHGGAGVLFAGLEHKAVAGRNCNGEHPEGHHRGEVEGADAGAHAERLRRAVAVNVCCNVLETCAEQLVSDAACRLNDLHAGSVQRRIKRDMQQELATPARDSHRVMRAGVGTDRRPFSAPPLVLARSGGGSACKRADVNGDTKRRSELHQQQLNIGQAIGQHTATKALHGVECDMSGFKTPRNTYSSDCAACEAQQEHQNPTEDAIVAPQVRGTRRRVHLTLSCLARV